MAANCCDSGLNPFGAKFYPQFILSQKSYLDHQSEENPELTRLMDVAAILMPKSLKSLSWFVVIHQREKIFMMLLNIKFQFCKL